MRVFVNVWKVPFVLLVAVVLLLLWTVGNEGRGNLTVDPFDFLYRLVPFFLGYGLCERQQLIFLLSPRHMFSPLQ